MASHGGHKKLNEGGLTEWSRAERRKFELGQHKPSLKKTETGLRRSKAKVDCPGRTKGT